MKRAIIATMLAGNLTVGVAQAHDLRPTLLSIAEGQPDEYQVELRMPIELASGGIPTPVLPAGHRRLSAPVRSRAGDHLVERFAVRIAGGLPGRTIGMQFGGSSDGEVLVRVATRDGRTRTGRLLPVGAAMGTPREASWLVPAAPTAWAVARTYVRLGIEHIATGLDHLAFVFGLILLTPSWRKVWKTVSAFTAAHSLTLALSTIGVFRLPPAPVEATIALSILFVAREVWMVAQGRPGPTAVRPWPLVFAFGLLHGLGFAGALMEVGVPETDVGFALLSFNVGVELGQLGFVAVVLLGAHVLARLSWATQLPARLTGAYVIGTLASFWCIERVSRFWG